MMWILRYAYRTFLFPLPLQVGLYLSLLLLVSSDCREGQSETYVIATYLKNRMSETQAFKIKAIAISTAQE